MSRHLVILGITVFILAFGCRGDHAPQTAVEETKKRTLPDGTNVVTTIDRFPASVRKTEYFQGDKGEKLVEWIQLENGQWSKVSERRYEGFRYITRVVSQERRPDRSRKITLELSQPEESTSRWVAIEVETARVISGEFNPAAGSTGGTPCAVSITPHAINTDKDRKTVGSIPPRKAYTITFECEPLESEDRATLDYRIRVIAENHLREFGNLVSNDINEYRELEE